MTNNKQNFMITVYISVNKKIKDVIGFILKDFLVYTEEGLKVLKKRYHELPLIL